MKAELSRGLSLASATSPQAGEALEYFKSFYPEDPRNQPVIDVKRSLNIFTEGISRSNLDEVMQTYRKEGAIKPEPAFAIKPVFGHRTVSVGVEGRGRFFMDAAQGLALGIEQPNNPNLWIGVLGFTIGNELDGYGNKVRKGLMDFPYQQFPTIVQLQGPSISSYGGGSEVTKKEAVDVLKDYKWERALIDIFLNWATTEEIPAAYLLPANLNWASSDDLKLRYDVSAQRSGFTMQPNGLYGTSLLGCTLVS